MTVRELINVLIDAEDKEVEVVISATAFVEDLKIKEVKTDRWSATLEIDFDSGELDLGKLDLKEAT